MCIYSCYQYSDVENYGATWIFKQFIILILWETRCMRFKILSALIAVVIFGCVKEKKTAVPLLDYIPQNASIIIKINDLQYFKSSIGDNNFLKTIASSGLYESVFEKVKPLDYLQTDSESILAFSELGKENFEFTFVTDESPILFNLDSLKNKSVETITYEGQSFDTYQIDGTALYSFKTGGKIVVCSAQVLLENLVRNLGKSKISSMLKRLYGTSNNSRPASIFLNLDKDNGMLRSCLKEDSKINTSAFSDWVSVDLSTGPDHMQLNGVSVSNDSIKNYVNLFRNTNPLTNIISSFAPMHADAILSYTFDDYSIFAKNQQRYLDRSTPMDSLFNTVEEIGFIYLNGQKAILLNTYGSENILEYLSSIKTGVFTYQGNEIFKLGSGDFLKNALYPIIKENTINYCSILENAFVFSENKETLQTIIGNYKNGATFDKTPVYDAARESLASESSILYISNSKGIEDFLQDDFKKELYLDLKKSNLAKYAFGMQLVADGNFFHINSIIQKIGKETRARNVSPIFNVQLDNEMATDPQFVVNHQSHKKEIAVQDVANILYLISSKGKILWKKQLEGRIQGRISQVDIYKNGRLQLAFTTDNQLLILDRNGKEVKPFTFKYQGGNLNPLAVFDYDGKKDYRFVVTQGEKVFMYNSKGAIVDGFKYTRAEKPITGVAKHFRIGGKDYLVFKLDDGNLKILNRVGNVRVKVKEKIDFSENEVYVYKNKFVTTDKKGTLYQIDPYGKITKKNFNLNKDHGLDATSNSLVLMNDNILNIKGRKIELDLGVYSKPKIFYIYDKIYVGVTDLQNQKGYLFDSQAKPIPNFPVFGTSLIDLSDLDNDRRLELVVKDQDNSLIVYKMN